MTDRVLVKPPPVGTTLCGTLQWAGAATSLKFTDRVEVKIEASWEGATKKDGIVVNGVASMYLPWKAAVAFAQAGLITQQSDRMKFECLKGSRFSILRSAEASGENTVHHWLVQAVDTMGQPIQLEPRPTPRSPLDEAQPAAAAPAQPQPAAPAAQTAPAAAQAVPPAAEPTPAKSQAPKNGNGAAERDREVAVKIDRCYALAVSIAMYRLMQVTGKRRADIDQRTVQAGAATIMIALDRGMYTSSSSAVAKAMLDKITALDAEQRN